MYDVEQRTKITYEKWYDRCLKVLADDERHCYEHPSREFRLELMRLPSLHDESPEENRPPCVSVTLELFYNDPLHSASIGMWTQNPAGMAMFFTGLELMEKEVDIS